MVLSGLLINFNESLNCIPLYSIYILVLSSWNDFQISVVVFVHRFDEFHDECEVIVRSIVELHWQSVILLVE